MSPSHTTVHMVDFARQWSEIRTDAIAAVDRVGESGWLILGNEVAQFETALAERCGRRFAIGCASGLDALTLSLRACDIGPGTRVVTTPLTAFATTLAILGVGAVPIFVDVDETGGLDSAAVEECLTTGAVDAVLPVHLYGHAMDVVSLGEMCAHAGAILIEDCAQSIGTAGAGVTGATAATSFYPTKNLGAYGDGGAVLTDDPAVAERVRCLRDYGQSSKYRHTAVGLNSRLDELQAAVLRSALLPRLERFLRRRREIAVRYVDGLRHPAIHPVVPGTNRDSSWHLFPVLVDGRRSALQAHLTDAGIQSGVHYPILCTDQEALAGSPHEVVGSLGTARQFVEHELSLPMHPFLSDQEVDRVIDACNRWSTPT